MSAGGRVLLVNPYMASRDARRLPLSVLALGAVLEGRHDYRIIDGNLDYQAVDTALRALDEEPCGAVGVTVMPGPQVATAIEISRAVRRARPEVPIIWGGYFPTLYAEAAINAPYVDYAVRGQGERTLLELLDRLPDAGPPVTPEELPAASSARRTAVVREVRGLTLKEEGRVVHTPDREFAPPADTPPYPFERLEAVEPYLRPSFMGRRTGVHQAAIGCRYRCTFCGVVSMFNGVTLLEEPERLRRAVATLRRLGADSVQFYDHNFFDRRQTSEPILEALAGDPMPWWCYARADTLANFPTSTWRLLEKSRLKMAYIGAEAGSDEVLRRMKKGSRVEHTFETARRCREHGVVPEFSFVLGGPEDPEGEIERTLSMIRRLKAIHPECEVVTYFYSPTPQRDRRAVAADRDRAVLPRLDEYGPDGPPLPTTPEEWCESRWIDYVCHRDAPWLSERVRQRVRDFATVLGCRFPTVQDYSTPAWGKRVLRGLASWRYAGEIYGRPWELRLARKLIPLREPQAQSI
ncbi:MAG: radical SAM protein [Thermoanaerobaculia bacterium]|nr:radical SAM protein [Thermoanaerobaculia bacterium]